MALFESLESAKTADIKVDLVSARDGWVKLYVNGTFYGMAKKGTTVDQDCIAVASWLAKEGPSRERVTEAMVGLLSLRSGDTATHIAGLILKFRKSKGNGP